MLCDNLLRHNTALPGQLGPATASNEVESNSQYIGNAMGGS
jgi:hypothetical protein